MYLRATTEVLVPQPESPWPQGKIPRDAMKILRATTEIWGSQNKTN